MKTKKLTTIVSTLLLVVSVLFTGCQKNELEEPLYNETQLDSKLLKSDIEYCGIQKLAQLQEWEGAAAFGDVTVGNDEDNLYVTFETSGDLWIVSAVLYAGSEEDLPGTINGDGTGTFSEWNFEHSFYPYDEVQEHTFTVDLNELEECLIVVAYARVKNIVTGDEYWVYGKEISKATGYYIEYCKQDCTPNPPLGGIKSSFAYNEEYSICFRDIRRNGTLNPGGNPWHNFYRWGWTNGELSEGTYEFEIWAAALGCDPTNGTLVGEVELVYDGSTATVTYNMLPGYIMYSTQLYVGEDILPKWRWRYRVRPIFYPNKHWGLNGARVIEKHITLDRNMKGTDHRGSLGPEGIYRMVRDIRNLEMAMGKTEMFASDMVVDSRIKLERSIATNREIKACETIKIEDLHMLSPGDGFKWIEKDKVIGKSAIVDIPKDEIIYQNMIK